MFALQYDMFFLSKVHLKTLQQKQGWQKKGIQHDEKTCLDVFEAVQ